MLMGQMMYFGGNNAKQVCFVFGRPHFGPELCLKDLIFVFIPRKIQDTVIVKVLKLEGCRMTRLADLPFYVYQPACNSFVETIPRILICFSDIGLQNCHT